MTPTQDTIHEEGEANDEYHSASPVAEEFPRRRRRRPREARPAVDVDEKAADESDATSVASSQALTRQRRPAPRSRKESTWSLDDTFGPRETSITPRPRGRMARQQQQQQQMQQPGMQQMQQPQQEKKGGNSALGLKLDLNLEVEITLKAKIHGDLTLTLLN